jgi:hypothetical protein
MDDDLREEIHTELYSIIGAAIDATRANPVNTVCTRAEEKADALIERLAGLIE